MKKILVVLAGAMMLLSACAGTSTSSSEDAKGTLVDALRALLGSESLTQTITIESDAGSLAAVSEGEIDAETAGKILESSVTTSAKQADDPADASSLTLIDVAGTDAVEIRFVEGDLYARVDVASLFETFGEDPAQIEALTAQVKGQKGFEWVEPAVAGEWVVVRDALALTQQMGGSTFNGEQQKKLVEDLLASIEKNATVTDEGEDDNGEHLRADLPLKETLQDLAKSLGPVGAWMAPSGSSMEEVPEGDLTLDFWVDDGTITQMAFDVTQLEELSADTEEQFPEGVEELTILIEIDEFDGTVEPVADAIEIDTTALTQAFSGLMTGGFGTGGSPGGGSRFDCSMLKGSPPEVVELYAEECPELQK